MSDEFGDFDEDDAFDTDAPDAEQVARKLHNYRRDHGFEIAEWESLSDDEREALRDIIFRLLEWLRRQGFRNG